MTCSAAGCDLSGTFATLTELDLRWDPVVVFGLTAINGGTDTTFSWAIRRHDVDGNTMDVEQVACGGTSPDFCSPLFSQAYAQGTPDTIWELSTMPVDLFEFNLPSSTAPGAPFVGPVEASVLGLRLPEKTSPWPASYTDPSITWLDHDGDGQPGVTSVMTLTGSSSACNLPYAGLPIPATGATATQVYTGSRSLGGINGTIVDCNTLRGALTGPGGGQPVLQGHVVGCRKTNGQLCTAAETESLDAGGNGAATQITAGRFTMVRVPDDITCAEVRAFDFPQ